MTSFSRTIRILLVDRPVPLLLLPVLENHSHTKHQEHVDSDHSETSSENHIEIAVGKFGELSDTATFLKRNDIGRASGISNKRRRSGVEVTAAIKLFKS